MGIQIGILRDLILSYAFSCAFKKHSAIQIYLVQIQELYAITFYFILSTIICCIITSSLCSRTETITLLLDSALSLDLINTHVSFLSDWPCVF